MTEFGLRVDTCLQITNQNSSECATDAEIQANIQSFYVISVIITQAYNPNSGDSLVR
jgi:hypothetical protein